MLDVADECSGGYNHIPNVEQIAEGSGTVLINRLPAARVKDGCPTVIIGGPTKTVHPIAETEKQAHEIVKRIKDAAETSAALYTGWEKAFAVLMFERPTGWRFLRATFDLTGDLLLEKLTDPVELTKLLLPDDD